MIELKIILMPVILKFTAAQVMMQFIIHPEQVSQFLEMEAMIISKVAELKLQ